MMPWYDRLIWGMAALSVGVFAALLILFLAPICALYIVVRGEKPWED